MRTRTLAHISDLHLGRSPRHDAAAAQLCRALLEAGIDHVVATGDLTHGGRNAELEKFFRTFAPLIERGRLSFVPGNHDRQGDDAGARLMHGERVAVYEELGLFLVRVDSTARHNRFPPSSHGQLCRRVIEQVYLALASAPENALRVVALHHHPVPLPEESVLEKLSSALRLPHAGELALGAELLRLIDDRCDLVLHGHRHVPRALRLGRPGGGALPIYNAGCSSELRRIRVFAHAAGRLCGSPMWLAAEELRPPVRPRRWRKLGEAPACAAY